MSDSLKETGNFGPRRVMGDAANTKTGALPGDASTLSGSFELGTELPQLTGERLEGVEVQFLVHRSGTFPTGNAANKVTVTIKTQDADDNDLETLVDGEEVLVGDAPGNLIRVPLPADTETPAAKLEYSVTAAGDFSGAKFTFGIAV